MSNAFRFMVIASLFSLSFGSCKSKKMAAPAKPKTVEIPSVNATLLKTIATNENHFEFYNARGSADYRDSEQSYNLNVDISMERDRYVYMNVTAFLGISVARLWFTADSVCILDILHKKNYITGYDHLQQMANVSLSLNQVQRILAGNTPYAADEQKMTVDSILAYILVNSPVGDGKLQTTYYNNSTLKVTRNILVDQLTSRELRVEYKECYTSDNNCFPKEFNINIRAEKNMECRINLDYFAFDKKKEVKFVVPKNFQNVRM